MSALHHNDDTVT